MGQDFLDRQQIQTPKNMVKKVEVSPPQLQGGHSEPKNFYERKKVDTVLEV